jgi:hypothetical protein
MKIKGKPEFIILMQMLKPEYSQALIQQIDNPDNSLGYKLQ